MSKEYAWRERTPSKETEEEEETRRTVHFVFVFVVVVLFFLNIFYLPLLSLLKPVISTPGFPKLPC